MPQSKAVISDNRHLSLFGIEIGHGYGLTVCEHVRGCVCLFALFPHCSTAPYLRSVDTVFTQVAVRKCVSVSLFSCMLGQISFQLDCLCV